MSSPILITADEINCLIFSYLEDSGFQHSAFAIRMEARLEQSPYFSKQIPRGELVELLSKALLYIEVEAHWKGDALTTNCKTGFSLLEPHICSLEPQVKPARSLIQPLIHDKGIDQKTKTNGDAGVKRKADGEDGRVEKRPRRTPEDMAVDPIILGSDSIKNKPKESKPAPQITAVSSENKQKQPRKAVSLEDQPNPDAIRLLSGHKSEIFVTAWNPAMPSLLATGSKDGIVHVWDVGDPSQDSSTPDLKPLKLGFFAKPDHGDLTSLDWNFDGSLLAIGSYDSILRICTASGKLYFSHRQHEGPIFAAKFSKSGQWLLSGSLDGSACIWNVKTKKLHMQYRCHTDCCLDLDWLDDNTFASCGADMVIVIMRINDQKPIKTLTGHTNEINQIKCNPSRTRLASCSDDRTARIWNVSDLSGSRSPDSESIPGLSETDRVVELEGHEHSVSSIAWCPQNAGGVELIATASFDSTARLWDSITGECLKVFSDHKRPIYALAFSPNGRWIGTGSGDGWFHVYGVKSKKKKWSWYAGQDQPGVFEISWQQSGNLDRIALALERNQVCVIDVPRITAMKDDS